MLLIVKTGFLFILIIPVSTAALLWSPLFIHYKGEYKEEEKEQEKGREDRTRHTKPEIITMSMMSE